MTDTPKICLDLIQGKELRPCRIGDKNALFHKWSDYSEIVPPSMMVGGHGGGVLIGVFGIVEYEDGSVKRVKPESITFVDFKHRQYCFDDINRECEDQVRVERAAGSRVR